MLLKDSDGDGVLEPDDACPFEPGLAGDGCPLRDSDGDGFLDRDDQCPEWPGLPPDGCVRDRDGDGLLDPADPCPGESETRDGWRDGDGCPDALPADLAAIVGVVAGVEFVRRKADLLSPSRVVLERVAAVLAAYPEVRVVVSVHSEYTGGFTERTSGSTRRRADTVKRFLVERGIDASRIEARGYGSDVPVASNNTAEGRARNRRVELSLWHE